MKHHRRLLVLGAVALVLVLAVVFIVKSPNGPGETLALQAPAFVQAAAAATSGTPAEVAAMLSNEAGISAYMQTSNPIDLSIVRGEFRTIETETSDYIIGSVAVPDHPEHFDVHVYVHTDGWILAYYLNGDATAKIVDVRSRTIGSTKLETIISMIAGALGETTTGLKYYDFRYPNATHILMVAEDHEDGRDFNITLPSEYGYSERSWAMINSYSYQDMSIDDTTLARDWSGSNMAYGAIPSSQLLPGEPHSVKISSRYSPYGVLVITYRVQ